jgi:hypothetical protein
MHYQSADSQTPAAANAVRPARFAFYLSIFALLGIAGCVQYADELELNPRAWAPPAVEREWSPRQASRALTGSATEVAALSEMPSSDKGRRLGLTELINYALAKIRPPAARGNRLKPRQPPPARRAHPTIP